MPRNGITYPDVEIAANELLNEGKPITIEQIRIKLGTGSSNTVSRHLKKFKEIQTHPKHHSILHDALPSELVSAVHMLWNNMVEHTKSEIEKITSEKQTELDKVLTESFKLRENNRRWQLLHGKWVNEKKQLLDENKSLSQALDFYYKNSAAQLVEKDYLCQQLVDKQTRVDELHQLFKQAQSNLEHFREASQKQFHEQASRHEQHTIQNQEENKRLYQSLSCLREENATLNNENKNYNKHIETLKMLNEEITKTAEDWQCKFVESNLEFTEINTELKVALTKINSERVELNNKVTTLCQEINSKDFLYEELKNIQQVITKENMLLSQDKSKLEMLLKQYENSTIINI